MDKMRKKILDEKKVVDEMLATVEKDLRQLEEKARKGPYQGASQKRGQHSTKSLSASARKKGAPGR